MSSSIDIKFTDFQEQIIHAIRDHTNRYNQHNIKFSLADYLTIQNQKASDNKIQTIKVKLEDVEASWSRIITKDLGFTLDKYKQLFIEVAKYRAILQALQEKRDNDDEENTSRKRKRDDEIREAADKKKRDEYTQWLVKHPKRIVSSSPSSSIAPLPQMQQLSPENMQSMIQLLAQQMMSFSQTADIKYPPTRVPSQNLTSPFQTSTSSQNRPSSAQSMASTNNDMSPYALSRSSSRASNVSEDSLVNDLDDMVLKET